MDHLDADEIRVLTPERDGQVCGRLNAWVRSYHEKARHPRARWTFYETQGRYLVIYWVAPPPPGQPQELDMIRRQTGWILDGDLNVLTAFVL